jgi:hypothetical protein
VSAFHAAAAIFFYHNPRRLARPFRMRQSMSDNINQIPSAWSAYAPILAGILRHVLGALGMFGFTWASAVTGSQIEMAVGIALMFGAALWSGWQKIAALRAARRNAVASASASAAATMQAGSPVAVVVGPSLPGTIARDL